MMAQSSSLRLQDSRAIWKLIGECRDLGDDRFAWREHFTSGLAALVDADVGLSGEMGGCRRLAIKDLGVSFWWQSGFLREDFIADYLDHFRSSPVYSPAMLDYLRKNRDQDGSCLTRKDFIEDSHWYRSHDFENVQRPFRLDTTMWCFRQIEGAPPDESSGVVLLREIGRRDFSPRDRLIIREAHRTLSPLIGGPLARYADPSPMELAPRKRRVLACLLEGDGDKQVAARLEISRYTVNEYTKAIYRHFGVKGRAELQARWIRRGWGVRDQWSRSKPTPPRESDSVYSRPA